jgi:hypothetical protein
MKSDRQHLDFSSLVQLCQKTTEYFRGKSVIAVNHNLVLRNWFVGHYIIKFEQDGKDRAQYGSGTLKHLAKALGRGFSVQNLELMRRFSTTFGPLAVAQEKSQTASGKSLQRKSQTVSGILELIHFDSKKPILPVFSAIHSDCSEMKAIFRTFPFRGPTTSHYSRSTALTSDNFTKSKPNKTIGAFAN